MPRFNLREFSTPAYAPYIPEAPVEERPAQKVADLLYFMHTLPWFSESEDEDDDVNSYNENMENSQAQKDEHEATMRESVKTAEDKKMDGYEPTDFDYDTAATLYNKDPNNVTRNPSEVEQEERIASNPLGSKAGGNRGPQEATRTSGEDYTFDGPSLAELISEAESKRMKGYPGDARGTGSVYRR